MTAYNKSTDFAIKDSLLSGNPSKLVRGSEIDTEFVAIQAADADNVKTSGLASGVATFLGTPTSANLAAALTDETGTGAVVFATSPTLVTPALGTPSALVGTNITGTAAGLTAGNVTTNANLTGHITSVGNAAVLGSFTSAQLATALTDETGSGANVFATSPTLVTPALGTPSSGVVTNLTGTASININGTVGATTPAPGTFTTLTSTGNAALGDAEASDIHTIKGATTILSNSASAALKVTNTGTGYTLLIEDSASADSTPIIFDANGQIGVGVAPTVPLDVVGTHWIRGAAAAGGVLVLSSDPTTGVTGSTIESSFASGGYGPLKLKTGGSDRLVLGTDGATTLLANSASAALTVTQTGAGNAFVVEDSTSPDSSPFVIDASGRTIIGHTTSVATGYTLQPAFQYYANGGVFGNYAFTANTSGGGVWFAKSRNATLGAHTIVQSGDELGATNYFGSDGAAFIEGARISAQVDGTPGTNDMPGRLVFSTTADGASSPTERMRIDSTGLVTLAQGQIKFPATQNASADANTLDDYEEGTFTPVVRDATAGNAATTSASVGIYTKIGRIVTCSITLSGITTAGLTAGNQVWISGLPFAVNATASYFAPTSVLTTGTTATTGAVSAYATTSNSGVQLRNETTTGGSVFTVSQLNSGSAALYLTLTYQV